MRHIRNIYHKKKTNRHRNFLDRDISRAICSLTASLPYFCLQTIQHHSRTKRTKEADAETEKR